MACPRLRPNSYQMQSPSTPATVAKKRHARSWRSSAFPASMPIASSIGTAVTGKPTCSANTFRNRIRYP